MKKYLWMDGARGVAIAAVFIYHFAESGGFGWSTLVARMASYGWAGVDLFFVLSGFLITKILVTRHEGFHRISVFYRDRALRIAPLYCVVLALAIVAFNVGYQSHPGQLARFNWSIPYLATFSQNWLSAQQPPIFLPFGMNHLWSLAVEVQFYVFWPALLLLTPKKYRWKVALGVFVASIAYRSYGVFTWKTTTPAYFSTWARLDSFMAGALVALCPRPLSARIGAIGMVSGLSMLFLCAFGDRSFIHSGPWMASAGYAANAVIFASLLIFMLASTRANILSSSLELRWLRWIGVISYGLYVLHYPLLHLFLNIFGRVLGNSPLQDVLIFSGWVIACLVLAQTSYSLLETRFLRMKTAAWRPRSMEANT